jgi:hypothetical protein
MMTGTGIQKILSIIPLKYPVLLWSMPCLSTGVGALHTDLESVNFCYQGDNKQCRKSRQLSSIEDSLKAY